MLAYVTFPWTDRDRISTMCHADYESLRMRVPQLNLSEWKSDDTPKPFVYVGYEQYKYLIDTEDDWKALLEFGLNPIIKNFKGTYQTKGIDHNGVTHELHVHVPNIGLLAIDEVLLIEDACTDNLQSHLDEGWRILAVCPPNCQRRPDYILGRTKKG